MNALPAITAAQIAAIRDAILEGERLLTYDELAARLQLKKSTVQRMVAARRIHPAIGSSNAMRFHWPSVVAQLQRS